MTDPTQKPKRTRRSSVQVAKDENALRKITEIIHNVDIWSVSGARGALVEIGDILNEAGRL